MNESKQLELSLKTLCATIFLGIAGDLLLRDVPWGVGFALYAFVIAAVAAYLYRQRTSDFGKGVVWLVPPALLFASLFAWRDSNDLKLLNGICLTLVIGVLALRVRSGNITVATLWDYPCRLAERWLCFLTDFLQLASLEGKWAEIGQANLGKKATSVVRGVLIAAPLFLVFAALFASSDAVFNQLLQRTFSFDASQMSSHGFVLIACVWIVGGFLRRLFIAKELPQMEGPQPIGLKLGLTEIVIVFGTLNSLFLAFVAIQFRYLFGGHAMVQTTAHLSYAEYAHQGFFELLIVAILGLGVLVGARSVVKSHENRDWRTFASLALTLVTLIFVVMASAVTRMQIYVQAYGITEERLYATAVLAWLTLVFCWFCATSLRRRPERFAAGTVASFLLVVFGLNAMNPDGFIVRMNTSRTISKVDGAYLGSLSEDAIPDLVKALPKLRPVAKANVIQKLKTEKQELKSDDWRSWDLSSRRASDALSELKL